MAVNVVSGKLDLPVVASNFEPAALTLEFGRLITRNEKAVAELAAAVTRDQKAKLRSELYTLNRRIEKVRHALNHAMRHT